MRRVTWRIDNYATLAAGLRDCLVAETRLWMTPPKDLAGIRAPQQ
jgi:hypothetical protein